MASNLMRDPIFLKIKQAIKGLVIAEQDTWRFRFRARLAPLYPRYINFPITRQCNSKCIMCNVWKEPSGNEISAEALAGILQDPLFKEIRSVGLSGGEPTLRSDLVDLARVLIDRLPKLKGISLITNGLQPGVVENQIRNLKRLCHERKIHLSVMISIDGLGTTHDRIRGVSGAFARVIESISAIKPITGIGFGLCCTINPENAGELDSVLRFAQKQNLPIKFRLATAINRLHNQDCRERISLTDDQRQQVAQFLEKMAVQVEKNWERIQFYWSLRDQLVLNKPRTVMCQWARDGVTLDEEGRLYYCAVKSRMLGATAEGPRRLYFDKNNLAHRRQIEVNECPACWHDYPTVLGMAVLREIARRIWRRLVRDPFGDWLIGQRARLRRRRDQRPVVRKPLTRVLVTGWYGTETTGDKAILAGIINGLRARYGAVTFEIISYNPFYTQETLRELQLVDAHIIPFGRREVRRAVKQADLVLMGGGPLMDIRDVFDVLRVMLWANKERKVSMLCGIGLGPLNQKKYAAAVKQIARHATVVTLRDQRSLDVLRRMHEAGRARVTVDPAWPYVRALPKRAPEPAKPLTIGVSLRDWPHNYAYGLSSADYQRTAESLPRIIAEVINRMSEKETARFILVPMNTFYVGGDDRDIFAQVLEWIVHPDRVSVLEGLGSPQAVAQAISACDLFIGMRFHSIVFAAAVEVPFIALDYTVGQGKIFGFVESLEQVDAMLPLVQLSAEALEKRVADRLARQQDIKQAIAQAGNWLDRLEADNATILDPWFVPVEAK